MDALQINRVVSALGGWPDYLDAIGRARGESMMCVVIDRRIIDQAVFVLVCRWAVHQSAFDRLSSALVAAEAEAAQAGKAGKAGDSYLTGDEQRRAYHENRAAALETQLLATPYQRVKSGLSAQTSFMDKLGADPAVTPGGGTADGSGGARTVTPFAPRARSRG